MTAPLTADALELVGTVARVLNAGLPAEDTLASVADAIRRGLAVPAVAIWRRDASAGTFSVVASPPRFASVRTLEEIEPGPERLLVPLVHGGVRLGLFEIATGPASPPSEVVTILQHLVSPFLDALTLAEDLALEVASRSREILEQRRFTALVIDSLPVGIYVIDRDYRIQFWNRKRETGTQGLRREQVVGRPVFEVLTRQAPEQLKADFDLVFDSGEVQIRDTVVELGSSRRVFRLSRIPMRLEGGGTITHVVTVGEDVTEARDTQAHVIRSEKLAAVGQLAAGVMHEINNPLATIAACSAAIEDRLEETVDPTVREYLEIIDKEVQRCTRIVDGLLEFSRPHSVGGPRAAIGLTVLIERTLFLLKHHKRFKKLEVTTELAPRELKVKATAEQLIQVLMAIMLNAVDAMREGGALRVRSRFDEDRGDAVIEIMDSGHGIPPTELGKIFDPFYTTKPAGQGTGLGLAIAFGIMQEHEGRIEVESEVGRGSTFRVILPGTMSEGR
ncbi:MAG: nitrogen regulation protein NR(II) [Gemmatimonadales bacterium]